MTISKAIIFATLAHEKQLDKSGQPYILHPLRVMLKMSSDEERYVALLHDVLEDTKYTVEDLEAEGFSHKVIDAVVSISKIDNESYENYLKKVKSNAIALKVKEFDIKDNLDRLIKLDETTQIRLKKKYNEAFKILQIEKYT